MIIAFMDKQDELIRSFSLSPNEAEWLGTLRCSEVIDQIATLWVSIELWRKEIHSLLWLDDPLDDTVNPSPWSR